MIYGIDFGTHVLRFVIGCINFLVELNRKSGNAYSHTLLGNRRDSCSALVPTLISDLTLILAVQHVGSTTTAVLGCMEPLTAVIMGVLFLGESCNFIQSIGICIILIAVTTVIIARNPHEIKKGLQFIPKLLHKIKESADRCMNRAVFSHDRCFQLSLPNKHPHK